MKLRILLLVLFTCGFIAACGTGHKTFNDARTPSGDVSNPLPLENRITTNKFIQCPEGMRPGIDYRPDEIIVGFKLDGFSSPTLVTGKVPFNKGAMLNPILYENEAIAEFAREIEINHNLSIIPNGESYVKNVNFCAYKLTPDQDANTVAAMLRMKYPDKVKYVEYNGIVRLAYYPNDPYYLDNSLWGLDKIRTDLAWDITTGDANQWIAVIDTGIYTDTSGNEYHEDLYNWGYFDVPEPEYWSDFVRGDKVPEDENGHGTHVAGTIAAVGDNEIGVVGIAYGSNIYPVKVLNADGQGSDANITAGILLADSVGCSVINMSLGSSYPNRSQSEACAQAFSDGVVIVAAAGNSNHQAPSYPGSYPEVINVGASDIDDNRASYSNYGYTVDIVAPGGDQYVDSMILSTYFDGGYINMQGTSMASPHVAGVAALIRANAPDADPLEVRALIEYFGDDVLDQGQWAAAVPLYRLNAYTPLNYRYPSGLPTIDITSHNDYDQISGDVTIAVDTWASSAVAGVHYYIDGQYYGWENTGDYDLSFNTQYLVPGEHTLTVEVIDTENAHGYDSVILDVTDTGIATPYWTSFDTPSEQEGWWNIDYANSNSLWQCETDYGNTWWYFGDLDKSGGRGYYVDDVDVLFSPSFDLTGMSNPYLYITAAWDLGIGIGHNGDQNDSIFGTLVLSSGDEHSLFEPELNNSLWPNWQISNYDLSDYGGLTGRLELWTNIASFSSEGFGFWLDNVVVSDSQSPPNVTITSPTPAANSLVQGTVQLNASATDDNGIVLKTVCKVGTGTVKTFNGPPSQFTFDSTTVSDGDRAFTVTSDDELSTFRYDDAGTATRTFYIHNTAPSGIEIDPPSARIGDEVTITGANFGREFAGETTVYFSGATIDVEADVTDWTNTSITCTVPDGTADGPVTVNMGILSGESASDFTVAPAITGFEFTSPTEGFFLEQTKDFTMTSQPYADRIEYEIAGHPEITLPTDNTPGTVKVAIDPADFNRNGEYTLVATAYAPGEEVTAEINFFIEVLTGDFNGDGVVDGDDLAVLLGSIWAEPGDVDWIPYLDTNRNGIIEEDDAAIVGYNYGNT